MLSLPTHFPINLCLMHTKEWRSMVVSALMSGKKHLEKYKGEIACNFAEP